MFEQSVDALRFITEDHDPEIRAAVQAYFPDDYPWQLFRAQLYAESGMDPKARSPSGALGLAQFMPETWKEWSRPHESPTDPGAAIDAGARYMRWLINEWHWRRPALDRWCLAMASYNAGLGYIVDAQITSGGMKLYAPIMDRLHEVASEEKADQAFEYAPKIVHMATAHCLYGDRARYADYRRLSHGNM